MTCVASSPADNPDWLVGNPTFVQQSAALWIGSVGLLILGLQPILLGAMFTEGRVNFGELAQIATAEFVMIAIGSAISGMLLSTRHLRLKSAVLLTALAVLNYAMSFAATPNELLLDRSLAGLVEGGIVAISIELIARSRHAERLGGFFISLQTLAQCILAAVLAQWIVPAWGSNGGFLVLAVVCVASLVIAALVPANYGELPRQSGNIDGVLSLRAILALLIIFGFFLFIGALWAFLEPLGAQYGIGAQSVGLLVSLSLAVQVLGALAATWTERRIHFHLAIVMCSIIAVAGCAVLAGHPSLPMFWAAVLVIAFLWTFIIPYQIGLAVAADSSRSTALLIPAAQLLGAAFGPLAASLFIVTDDVKAVPYFGICALVASLVLLGLFLAVSRGRAVAA